VGLPYARLPDLQVSTVDEAAGIIREIVAGKPGPHRDIAVLNAAGALVVAEACPDLKAGIARATQAIDSGAAKRALECLIQITAG
jgi:anthranilate phosphoribosyltransferase